MLPVKQAEKIILDLVQPLDSEKDVEIVNLEAAYNRILAGTVISQQDFPYWDNSAMDGYAVRYEDVKSCAQDNPVVLTVIEEIPAGYQPQITVQSGQAARIFTGAMMPPGADTIVIQENTEKLENKVKILAAPEFQAFVRHRGSFCQAGTSLLETGIILKPADIAVLATAQCTQLKVYRRPRVAIFSTGDELIPPDQTLQPGQIIDSNQYALASFVLANGGIPINLGIVPDKPAALKEVIKKAIAQRSEKQPASADIVLSTGGVSVGDYDYIEQILAELGGEIHIRSVAVKPGKPLTVATFSNSCLYFGIPGNPVSALVSCWRFVQPALRKLSGLKSNWLPTFIKAVTCTQLPPGGSREIYLWGKLHLVYGNYQFELASGSHSSGNLINLSQTNALAILPVGEKAIDAGEQVMVMKVN
jgi:molybdopterin molybdotransferase